MAELELLRLLDRQAAGTLNAQEREMLRNRLLLLEGARTDYARRQTGNGVAGALTYWLGQEQQGSVRGVVWSDPDLIVKHGKRLAFENPDGYDVLDFDDGDYYLRIKPLYGLTVDLSADTGNELQLLDNTGAVQATFYGGISNIRPYFVSLGPVGVGVANIVDPLTASPTMLEVRGHIGPGLVANTYDLGTATYTWRYGYFGTGVYIGGVLIGASTMLTGTGTAGRVAEFGAAQVLQNSTLAKTGAGVLTLSAAAGAYTVTMPGTGTVGLVGTDTYSNIVAGAATLGFVRLSSDRVKLMVADGSSWYQAEIRMTAKTAVPDMGGDADSADVGYAPDYVTDKRLSNCLVGSNGDMNSSGDIGISESAGVEQLEIYINGATAVIPTNFRFREDPAGGYQLEHKPAGLTWWYEVMSGNSDELDLYGNPAIQQYQADMGGVSSPLVISGGTF